jgi:hypothetical protein
MRFTPELRLWPNASVCFFRAVFASARPMAYSWASSGDGPQELSMAAPYFLQRAYPMAMKNLLIGVCCLVMFGGAFAAGFVYLNAKSRTAADLPSSGPVQLDGASADNASGDATKPAGDNPQPNLEPAKTYSAPAKRPAKPPKETPKKPLTCVEATKLGADSVGKRVTWVGKWTHSQSSGNGEKHTFDTQGPSGEFSFDYPFEAEDPRPRDQGRNGESITSYFDRKWGPSRVVTLTGTISRVETLIFIGRGTRYSVPVLTDIKITINP